MKRTLSTILIAAATLGLGFLIGTAGSTRHSLDGLALFMIPAGGWSVGLVIGALQSLATRVLQVGLTLARVSLFAILSASAWFVAEYGFYATQQAEITDPSGNVRFLPIHDALNFGEYLHQRLASSEYQSKDHDWMTESFDRTGTTIFFVLDHIGASVGALVILLVFRASTIYCTPCQRYYRKLKRLVVDSDLSPADLAPKIEHLKSVALETPSASFLASILSFQHSAGSQSMRTRCVILLKQCRSCSSACVACTVSHRNYKGEFQQIPALGFTVAKQGNEATDEQAPGTLR
jgi:hypothetical protein